MTPRRKLVRRIRRKVWGGRLDMRIYDNGTMRARFDHPSNDPELELAMAGRLVFLARERFAASGMAVNVGPIQWRDDP